MAAAAATTVAVAAILPPQLRRTSSNSITTPTTPRHRPPARRSTRAAPPTACRRTIAASSSRRHRCLVSLASAPAQSRSRGLNRRPILPAHARPSHSRYGFYRGVQDMFLTSIQFVIICECSENCNTFEKFTVIVRWSF